MDLSNETIQRIVEYILANYKDNITLSGTAEMFNMSESSLSKKFKAFTGHRFREYLVDVRTHAAAELLRQSELSMTEIACECGFSDSNTFGDTFKRVFKQSPSSYRKNSVEDFLFIKNNNKESIKIISNRNFKII